MLFRSTTHAQACACALLNARFNDPPIRVPYLTAIRITRFSILEEDAAIGRLLHLESEIPKIRNGG